MEGWSGVFAEFYACLRLCALLFTCFIVFSLKAIGTAFAVLSDADKRAHYDRWGDDDGPQVCLCFVSSFSVVMCGRICFFCLFCFVLLFSVGCCLVLWCCSCCCLCSLRLSLAFQTIVTDVACGLRAIIPTICPARYQFMFCRARVVY